MVRRLWAIKESHGVRIIVTLGPTNDGDEVYPAWLANAREWTQELQSRLGESVELEVVDALWRGDFAGDLVADLSWRDSSLVN